MAVLAIAGGVLLAGCGQSSSSTSSVTAGHNPRELAVHDAHAFVDRYVAADGRVVRRDQGGDTVSEGQGYGLLLAFVIGDRPTFARIWRWTQDNLGRADGLFAFRWAGGRIQSDVPAADADVQIAWALDLAGSRWGVASYTAAARRTAEAVAAEEVGYDDQGRPTLAAGPWAITTGRATTVEPGYWTFPADTALASLTGDHRWQALSAADTYHLRQLSAAGHELPADWALVGGGRDAYATSAPGSTDPAVSGQDGLRALVWASCDADLQPIAAAWWQLQAESADASPLSRTLSGSPAASDRSPLSAVAAAATAKAAGDLASVSRLLAEADSIAARYPTYYGQAWAALGRIAIDSDLLPGC